MILRRLILIVALLGAPCFAEDVTWQRYPVLGVPTITTPPTIDGAVTEREWRQASSTDWQLESDGRAALDRTTVYFATTDTHLYVAFQCERPASNRAPTPDDAFTLIIQQLGGGPVIAATATLDAVQWSSDVACDYRGRETDFGWEGELAIAFADSSIAAPGPNTAWRVNFGRDETTPRVRTTRWSYVGTLGRAEPDFGMLVFSGRPVAVSVRAGWLDRYHEVGAVATIANFSDQPIAIDAALSLRRADASPPTSFHATVEEAMTDDLGDPRGDLAHEIAAALEPYAVVRDLGESVTVPAKQSRLVHLTAADEPGEYVSLYRLSAGELTLAAAAVPVRVPEPMGLTLDPHLLTGALVYEIDLRRLKDQIPSGTRLELHFQDEEREIASEVVSNLAEPFTVRGALRRELEPGTTYGLQAVLRDGDHVIAERLTYAATPTADLIPAWWTADEGRTPAIPPPFEPVSVEGKTIRVVGREYRFSDTALPEQIVTKGHEILAGPVALVSSADWIDRRSDVLETSEEAATLRGTLARDGVRVTTTTRVEFDGFMLIDVELAGSGALDQLDLVIPLKREHAALMQNYFKAPGPGQSKTRRFTGLILDAGVRTPPFITTWVGTDRYGLEWSCESSRGWSMAEPNEAIVVQPDGDVVTLTVHLISRPITLSDVPRRIRFGLVATPTKPLLPYVQKARMFDDVALALLPADWSGHFAWHPPMSDPAKIESTRRWVQQHHERHQQLLVNGGWNVSVQDADNALWVKEMFCLPMRNVSFGESQQYGACWNSPYGRFMVSSFAHNARLLGFDGIRFDTVIPGYECNSLAHDCGWFDDDGNLWGSVNIFAAREVWKRLYRVFHGGVIDSGWVYTPNAAGPIMAVHSFSDHHEIGEGFYQKAPDLKTGYPPDMVRAVMTGAAYGFREFSNIKEGPLFYNERCGALLVNNAEPQMRYLLNNSYAPHGIPGIPIWEAWEWVDRFNAEFRGWWENSDLLAIDDGDDEIYGSFWHNPRSSRALLVVTNYEKHPIDDLPVRLALDKLGLSGPLFAEDAVTGEPVELSPDGVMKLDLFGQRYRLIRISPEPPRFAESRLGPNLLSDAPEIITTSWKSKPITFAKDTLYVLSADVRIDRVLGEDKENPNRMGKFSPSVRHYVTMTVTHPYIRGAIGNVLRSDPEYVASDNFRRYYAPQWWEPTPGFMRMFSVYRTIAGDLQSEVVIGMIEPDAAQVRNISLRAVQPESTE